MSEREPKKRAKGTSASETAEPKLINRRVPWAGSLASNELGKRLSNLVELKADPLGKHAEDAGPLARLMSHHIHEAVSGEALAAARLSEELNSLGSIFAPDEVNATKRKWIKEALRRIDERIKADREAVGDLMAHAVEHYTPEQMEEFFRGVVQMKREIAALPRRTAHAYAAYSLFVAFTKREPTKPELKKFMIANRARYGDQPGPEDKSSWTRLWKASGLSTLSDR